MISYVFSRLFDISFCLLLFNNNKNLDNWKSSRRKRVEHIIDRVVEVKKLELEEHDRTRRKSKTFSEMLEERWVKKKWKKKIFTKGKVLFKRANFVSVIPLRCTVKKFYWRKKNKTLDFSHMHISMKLFFLLYSASFF